MRAPVKASELLSFRLAGIFLFVMFACFFFDGVDLFLARDGWRAEPAFWNVLTFSLSPFSIRVFFLVLALAALALTADFHARWAALVLFYGLVAMASVEIYITEAHWAFLGWMLLARFIYPSDERAVRLLRGGTWILFGISFSVCGLSKFLGGDWWKSGEAIALFIGQLPKTPLAVFLLGYPNLLKLLSWLVLAFELGALPLVFWKRTRAFLLFFLAGMHFTLGFLLGSPPLVALSCGMLIFYFFLAELGWEIRFKRQLIKIMNVFPSRKSNNT